jgi:peptidoglycan glycosyltransferase
MTRELRRLSLIMLAMFVALFGATSWIQVVQAGDLSENPLNKRALYDSFEVQRGSIIAGDRHRRLRAQRRRVRLAAPVRRPADVGAGHGLHQPVLNSLTGLEQSMNRELSGTANSQFLSRIDQIITGQPRAAPTFCSPSTRRSRKLRSTRSAPIRAPSSRSSPRPGASSRW